MRKITSLILIIAGIIELVTSVILYIIPAGRVSYWSDYHILWLSKDQWTDIHITVGTLFVLASVLHMYYNWRPFVAYLKNKARQLIVFNWYFTIALILSLYVTIGTIYSLPPMNYVLEFGNYISGLGNEKYGEPPYGHAELSSLKLFCRRMNINLERTMEKLKNSNINVSGTEELLKNIAKNNGITPQQVYDVINPAKSGSNGPQPFPNSPPPGFGNRSVKNICQSYNLSLDEVMTEFRDAGYDVKGDDTVRKIGEKNKRNPMKIFELFKHVAHRGQVFTFDIYPNSTKSALCKPRGHPL